MEDMNDLISRETMEDAIDSTTWYHQNRNGVMVEGAPGVEDAWFKAEDVFKAIENVPTAQPNTPTDTPTDLISRQAAIDALNGQISVTGDINAKAVQNYIRMVNQRLHDLPSAQPERCEDCRNFNKARLLIPQPERRGKWYHGEAYPHHLYCSVCYRTALPNDEYVERWGLHMNFCPNCGARMEGAEE